MALATARDKIRALTAQLADKDKEIEALKAQNVALRRHHVALAGAAHSLCDLAHNRGTPAITAAADAIGRLADASNTTGKQISQAAAGAAGITLRYAAHLTAEHPRETFGTHDALHQLVSEQILAGVKPSLLARFIDPAINDGEIKRLGLA